MDRSAQIFNSLLSALLSLVEATPLVVFILLKTDLFQGLFVENRGKRGCFGGFLKTSELVAGVFIEGQANPTWRERASQEGSRALAVKLRICLFCSEDVILETRKSRVCSKLSSPLCQAGEWAQAVVWDMGMGIWIWGCGSGFGDMDMGLWVHRQPWGSSVSPPAVQILQDRTGSPLQCNSSSFLAAGISGTRWQSWEQCRWGRRG